MAKKREKSVNVSGKPKHSLDDNRDNGGGTKGGHSASTVRLKMYKTRPKRDAKGKILKHDLQSKELPSTRIQPNRRWFGTTRVVNQKELEFFRDELQTHLSSNYNVILKERKLPMSLLSDHQKQARVHLLDTEPFADAFGLKKKRKCPKLVVSDYEALAKKADGSQDRPKRTLLGWKDKTEKKENESPAVFRNKEKVLVTCSRRINYRYRHLMLNVVSILPHCKKESKVESKATKGATLNELVELKSCSSCLFFECRKHKDLYLWMAKCPSGPSVKFLVNAVHTMEELKLTGNHLNGSRPLLTFSTNFDKDPRWKLLKEMIMQIFGTPKDHRKSKPYHDHVFVFSIVDDHIWFRNYQISCPHAGADKIDRGGLEKMTLVEVGPRFCLNPIKIFGGSFGGPTLYENPFYVSPNQIRALEKKQKAGKYAKKVKAKTRRKMHELSNPLEQDEFADIWKD